MKTIINNHIKNVLGAKPSINTSNCKCPNKEAWPLNEQCQRGEVVHEDTFSRNKPNYKEKKYFGIAEESFKEHLYNYKFLFQKRIS